MSQSRTVPTSKGFGSLPCPRCDQSTTVSLNLDDLDTFRCTACESEFTTASIKKLIGKWSHVLAWLETAIPPAQE